jgi:predicted PurR-regulated permease PerM
MRRSSAAKLALAFAAAAIVLYVLYVLRHAWLVIYVAIVFAIMFDPAVRLVGSVRVGRWHPSRGLSVAAVSILVLAIVAAIVFFIVPPIADDARRLEHEWPRISSQSVEWVHQHLPFSSSMTTDSLKSWTRKWSGGSLVRTFGTNVLDILTILLIAVYLLADPRRVLDWSLSLVPERHRHAMRTAFAKGARRMQGWVGGQAILMVTHGGSAFLTFWLLGLPYYVAVAVFAAVINVIPFLGPILTLIVAGLIAAAEAPGKLPGVIIFYLVYHNVEGILLQPRIMSHAVGVPGVTVVVALLVGWELAGIVGMLVSVPTAVLIAELKTDLLR